MQLAPVGRNEPCHCGSGRKYKKCCLGSADVALTTGPGEVDVSALVDAAVASGDWGAAREVFDVGFAFFSKGQPFEHVRFPSNVTNTQLGDLQQRVHIANDGWVRWAERELVRALAEFELRPEQRSGIRMAIVMLRRFGAKSPVVHELALLQGSERAERERRFGDTVDRLGLTIEGVAKDVAGLPAWLAEKRPSMLSFPDWFALQLALPEQIEERWRAGIAVRVCDANLNYLTLPTATDHVRHLQLVGIGLSGGYAAVGLEIARHTEPRTSSDDERLVAEAIRTDTAPPPESAARIATALVHGLDFAGAAMFRATLIDVAARMRT